MIDKYRYLIVAFTLLHVSSTCSSALAHQFKKVTRGTIAQRVDQSRSDGATFSQRYFIIEDLVLGDKAKAPVLFYMCSHESCVDTDVKTGALQIAYRLGAWVVGLEQRFRGESQPFNDMSPASLKYLTLQNVLHDLATFQYVARDRFGLKGPWITYGASYAGTMAAFYRSMYPHLAAAAISSSAPIFPAIEVPFNDEQTGRMIGKTCSDRFRGALEQVDTSHVSRVAKLSGLKELTRHDTMLILELNALDHATWGLSPPVCSRLLDAPKSNLEIIIAWAEGKMNANPDYYIGDPFVFSHASTDDRRNDGMHQWAWLQATQFGWYSVSSGSGPTPQGINIDYYKDFNRRKFGIATISDSNRVLSAYLERILNGSEDRILFITYKNDPWLSVQFTSGRARDFPASRVWYIENPSGYHSQEANNCPKDAPLRDMIIEFVRKVVPADPSIKYPADSSREKPIIAKTSAQPSVVAAVCR